MVLGLGEDAISHVKDFLASEPDLPSDITGPPGSDATVAGANRTSPTLAVMIVTILLAVLTAAHKHEMLLITAVMLAVIPLVVASVCGCPRHTEVTISVPRGFSFSAIHFSGPGRIACSDCVGYAWAADQPDNITRGAHASMNGTNGTSSSEAAPTEIPVWGAESAYEVDSQAPESTESDHETDDSDFSDEEKWEDTEKWFFDPRSFMARPLHITSAGAIRNISVRIISHGSEEKESVSIEDWTSERRVNEYFDGETDYYLRNSLMWKDRYALDDVRVPIPSFGGSSGRYFDEKAIVDVNEGTQVTGWATRGVSAMVIAFCSSVCACQSSCLTNRPWHAVCFFFWEDKALLARS
eukprot:SAG22_NODE_265_length_13348_cov_150.719149_5_plen_354_part_00